MSTFICTNCGKSVGDQNAGTAHRNHCPYCLWSVHLDRKVPGDRLADCGGAMEPIGLAYKSERQGKQGELSLVHRCGSCSAVSKNRLAADDDAQTVLDIYRQSLTRASTGDYLLLDRSAEREIITQLFGKPYAEKYFASPR